jgi:hypothetical protein
LNFRENFGAVCCKREKPNCGCDNCQRLKSQNAPAFSDEEKKWGDQTDQHGNNRERAQKMGGDQNRRQRS